MSQINMNTVALAHNAQQAAAAVRTAMGEVADARTLGEKLVARAHLRKAEDRFVKSDGALHHAQAHRSPFAALSPHHSASYYQGIARHHLANLERTGFARPTTHIACPHYASPEARQRATLHGICGAIRNLNTQLESLMGRLATNARSSTSGTTGADPDLAAIANNPTLGIEDKIALFMAKYCEKNNKEIEDKLKELAAAKKGQTNGSSANGQTGGSSKSGGGWFSSCKSFFKHLGGSLPKIAGTVIGGMYGGPAGAALGAKLGGTVGNAIGGSSGSSSSGQTNGANGANGANGTNGTQDASGAKDQTTLETELQRLTQKREQLVKMLTDLLATLHRTTMSVVSNIKP